VELIAVVALVGIIAAFSSLFIVTGVSSYVTARENGLIAQQVSLAMTRIMEELGSEMASVMFLAPAETAQKTHVKYAVGAGQTTFRHLALVGSGTRKRIVLVQRDTPDPSTEDEEVLLDGVSAFTLEWLDAEGGPWAVADGFEDLAEIVVTVTVFVGAAGNRTESFVTRVHPIAFQAVIARRAGLPVLPEGFS
jgi:hypothetical protein